MRDLLAELKALRLHGMATGYAELLEKNPERGCHIGKPWWVTKG